MNRNLEEKLLSLQDDVSELISASGALKGAMNKDKNFPPKLAEFPDANLKLLNDMKLIIAQLQKSSTNESSNNNDRNDSAAVMLAIRKGEILNKDLQSLSSAHDIELYFHSWLFREAKEISLYFPLMHGMSIPKAG